MAYFTHLKALTDLSQYTTDFVTTNGAILGNVILATTCNPRNSYNKYMFIQQAYATISSSTVM